eukprot:PhF_6_TR27813/c0_g2_i1/m.40561
MSYDADLILAQKLHMELNGLTPGAPGQQGPVLPGRPLPTTGTTIPSIITTTSTTASTNPPTIVPIHVDALPAPKPPGGTKGLDNPTGHNNCFLNVVLQSLSHLRPFVIALQQCRHQCGDKCVVCAVRHLLLSLTRDKQPYLDPAEMRERIQDLIGVGLRDMGDAVETFDSIVSAACQRCPPDDPLQFVFGENMANSMIVNVSEIVAKSQGISAPLSQYVMANMSIQKTVDVLTFQIIWNQPKYNASPADLPKDIETTLDAFPQSFVLGDFFESHQRGRFIAADSGAVALSPGDVLCHYKVTAQVKSIIAYYGKHYFTYSYLGNENEKMWFKFDDREVRPKGSTWEDVKKDMVGGRAQPMLIFYELQMPTYQENFFKLAKKK